jgi:hypothetical protein
MLEQAQNATHQGDYEVVRYTRFADDRAPRRRGRETEMVN